MQTTTMPSSSSVMTRNGTDKDRSARTKGRFEGRRGGRLALTPDAASPKVSIGRMAGQPNTIVVLDTDQDIVTLDLCLCAVAQDGSVSDKEFIVKSMARDANEAAAKTIDRIRLLYAHRESGTGAKPTQKKTDKDTLLATCPAVVVLGVAPDMASTPQDWQPLDLTLSNRALWSRARALRITPPRTTRAGEAEGEGMLVRVRYNVPTIVSLTPPSRYYVGLPLLCTEIKTLFARNAGVRYEWCRTSPHAESASGMAAAPHTVLSTESVFVPGDDLLGERLLLRVMADPGHSEESGDATSDVDVQDGLWTQVTLPALQRPPAPVPRWAETRDAAAYPAFRVVSYNILHDDFCTSKSSKERLYPFATDEILSLDYRRVRILQELLAYQGDIVCLQECGRKLFEHYLQPALEACGYDGHYANKSGNVQEGCALFFRRERFARSATTVIPLNWQSIIDKLPSLATAIAPHTELQEALTHLTTIGTIHLLRERATGTELVVGNTHLFYHANACHIRILQLYLFLHELHKAAAQQGQADSSSSSTATTTTTAGCRPTVLCGDFNFTHSTGGYRLATTAQLEPEHVSWEKGKLFWWGCDRLLGYTDAEIEALTTGGQEVKYEVSAGGDTGATNKDTEEKTKDGDEAKTDATNDRAVRVPPRDFFHDRLHTPMRLVDAYDRTDPSLPWTNYTMTFREVIDYIFFTEQSVDVLRTIPIPPESALAENFALPNANYPSDHVALIADLTLKTSMSSQ